jgi:hypothetical protein
MPGLLARLPQTSVVEKGGAVCDPVLSTTKKPDTQHALTDNDAAELSQLMEGTTAGALIPEIERRGFQELLEAEVSALTGAQFHERCPDPRHPPQTLADHPGGRPDPGHPPRPKITRLR